MDTPSNSPPPSNGDPGESHVVATPTDPPGDIVVVQGPTEHGVAIVRVKAQGPLDQRIEVGELRALQEGQPIVGEVLKLTPRSEDPRVFNAEVIASAPMPKAMTASSASSPVTGASLPHKGPARVTTEAFRSNWDGIFGARPTRGAPN